MAPDDIVGTDTWTEQILAAIADSKAMIVLVSSASNKSPHVSREVNLALGKRRAVLPIRIEDVSPGGSLEYLLSLVQRLDAFPPPIENHKDRILRRLESVVQDEDATQVSAPVATTPTPLAAPLPPAAASPMPPAVTPLPQAVTAPVSRAPVSTASGARGRTGMLVGGAIAVVVIALLGAAFLFKGPGASPAPTGLAVATVEPGETGIESAPATTVVPTSGPGGLLSADELVAQNRLPVVDPGTAGCSSWVTPPGGDDVLSPSGYATSTARLTCPGPDLGGPQARYAMYPSKEALDADFASIMTGEGVAEGSTCTTAIPADAPWNFPTFPKGGDLACYARNGAVQYVWTDHDLRILGQWLAPDNAQGLAFWRAWEQARNPAEQALVADIPTTIAGVASGASCVRAADDYYPTALAILACPRADGGNAVFYASFPPADAYPNDPMTVLFQSIMTGGNVPADTSTGCYESSFGRYTWGYNDNGVVGEAQGYVGCYQRTDTEPATVQVVWTFNRTATMGLWNAPDVDTGTKFFDSWISAVK